MTRAATKPSNPLPWHSIVWSQLIQLNDEQRLPHALLLEGATGTGRSQFAEGFGRYLLCDEPTPEASCGTCKACMLTESGAHSDLLHLCPEEPGKATGIDAVRQAIRFVGGSAVLGTRKVLIVDPAEALTLAACNAFLKCLEEPTDGTHLILVAPSGYPLPATIRSRCQRWRMSSPPQDAALEWLRDEFAAEDDALMDDSLQQLLSLTGNRPLQTALLARSSGVHGLLAIQAHAHGREPLARAQLEGLVKDVDIDGLLQTLEKLTQDWLRQQEVRGLRSKTGRNAFNALQVLEKLRAARRGGSNPNVDLLRFSAVHACAGLWES